MNVGRHAEFDVGPIAIPIDWAAIRRTLRCGAEGPSTARTAPKLDGGPLGETSLTASRLEWAPRPASDDLRCRFEGPGISAQAILPRQFFEDIGRLAGLSDAATASLPPDVALLVIEQTLIEPLRHLEEALGGPVRLVHLEDGDADPRQFDRLDVLAIELRTARMHHIAHLLCESDAATRIERLFPAPSPSPRLPVPRDMMVLIALCSPSFFMSVSDVRASVPGDVVLLDQRWKDRGALWLRGGGMRMGGIDRTDENGGVRFIPDATMPNGKERVMNHPEGADPTLTPKAPESASIRSRSGGQVPAPKQRAVPAAAEPASPALDALSVEIVVELERSQMPLGELRRLSSGSVLPLSGTFESEVAVTVNGAPFARGELVQIGDQIGVRLAKLD